MFENTKSSADLKRAIIQQLPNLPNKGSAIEDQVRLILGQTGSLNIRISNFVSPIKDEVIEDIFKYIQPESFIRLLKNNQALFQELSVDISKFRRDDQSRGDPADKELHRLIDILSAMMILRFNQVTNKYQGIFVGQDGLRRIFGSRMDEISRDILSCFIQIRILTEIPANLDIVAEARASFDEYVERIDRMVNNIMKYNSQSQLPFNVIKGLYADETVVDKFLYGGYAMNTRSSIMLL